jgi:mono/diheme cytochrome c family protein
LSSLTVVRRPTTGGAIREAAAVKAIAAGHGGVKVSSLPRFASCCAAGSGSSEPTAYNRPVRTLVSAALILLMTIAGVAQTSRRERPAKPHPSPAAGFESIVRPFLAQHCFGCHGNKGEPEKGLNLQSFESIASLTEHRDRWDEVVRKLRGSEMPPIEEEQPDEEQRQAVATWIGSELERIDRSTPPDPGRVTARRLNRYEYNNTIKELLGVDLKPADDFPQDDSGYGFDNIGDVLSLSPALMEKYVTAADRVARHALFGPPVMEPTLIRLRSDGRRARDERTFPATYDVTGLSMPNAFHAIQRIPVDGEYSIRVVLGGVRPKGSEPVTVALWIDEEQVRSAVHDPERSATFSDDRQDFGGQTVEFRVPLKAGDRWIAVSIPKIFEGLPSRLGGPNPSKLPPPKPAEFKPPEGAPAERVATLRKRFEETQAELERLPLNAVRISTLDLAGPYSPARGPSLESRRKIYTCGHLTGAHTSACVPVIVRSLARRAFRRPLSARETDKYVDLVRSVQKQEGSLEEGLAVGIQALLVSPDFLFRIEHNRSARSNGVSHPISQHELASRLSYFLWASMPDAELRRVADAGTLRNPAVLTAQVRRMLRDPKSHALAEQFGGQWLQFRALESITRDRDRFPEFEDYLRLSMRRETEMFIEHIIRDDRSILDFIDGRYSYLNERLARHYGIQGVSGPEFRRVDLTGSPRGGVITHASVLSVSSYATRTSPVLRGKWILENLLNAPPPEPPPDVPNLDEATIGTTAALRDQLEAHRQNPTCASCHKKMDPLGFGLENFDAVGAWRTMDGKFPVDASGTLPDGRTFEGPEELRRILRGDREAFARAVAAKLLTYALGRGLERYDNRTVARIAARLPRSEYRFSGLVLEIVNSLPFQSRRSGENSITTNH